MRQLAFLFGFLALAFGLSTAHVSSAAEPVRMIVLRENGIGSAAQIQKYLDKLVEVAKEQNGWDAGEGKYTTKRKSAVAYVDKHGSSVKFGMLSLGAYLGLREDKKLTVLGTVEASGLGGRTYHIISKDQADLAGCKGKKLATNHASDDRFINRVVSGGDFNLGDFVVAETKRPVQTIKAVIKGEADCALIDDAQYKEIKHIEGGDKIKSVWKSKQLPPMAVVAFSGATDAERAKFRGTLGSTCTGKGKDVCDKVGIQSMKEADESVYKAVIEAYKR